MLFYVFFYEVFCYLPFPTVIQNKKTQQIV